MKTVWSSCYLHPSVIKDVLRNSEMQCKKDRERIMEEEEEEEAMMAGWYPGTDSQYWAEDDGEDYTDEASKGGRTATSEGFEHPSEQDFESNLTAKLREAMMLFKTLTTMPMRELVERQKMTETNRNHLAISHARVGRGESTRSAAEAVECACFGFLQLFPLV